MQKKSGENWTCTTGDVIVDRQTDRHGHHSTPLPYWGRVEQICYDNIDNYFYKALTLAQYFLLQTSYKCNVSNKE